MAIALSGSANASPGAINYLPVATPQQVYSASLDCWMSVKPLGADRNLLRASGWKPKQLSVPVAARLRVFGKESPGPIIILTDEGAEKKGCIVAASLSSPERTAAAIQRLAERIGASDRNRVVRQDSRDLVIQTAAKRLVALPNGKRTTIRIYVVSIEAETK